MATIFGIKEIAIKKDLEEKQNTLVVGEGIKIEGNTISIDKDYINSLIETAINILIQTQ